MRNHGVSAIALGMACSALACGGVDGERQELFTQTFVSLPSPGPSSSAPPAAEGVVSYEPSFANDLSLTGHLEGELRGIPLYGDTTENVAWLERYDGANEYLNLNAAMGTPSGAGMIILSVDGGTQHPVFTEGTWSSAKQDELLSSGALQRGAIYVASCAGPALGNYPYEQQAIDYEMTTEQDPEQPGTTVVVVAASFYADAAATQTSELQATLRFQLPDPAADR